MTVNSK